MSANTKYYRTTCAQCGLHGVLMDYDGSWDPDTVRRLAEQQGCADILCTGRKVLSDLPRCRPEEVFLLVREEAQEAARQGFFHSFRPGGKPQPSQTIAGRFPTFNAAFIALVSAWQRCEGPVGNQRKRWRSHFLAPQVTVETRVEEGWCFRYALGVFAVAEYPLLTPEELGAEELAAWQAAHGSEAAEAGEEVTHA